MNYTRTTLSIPDFFWDALDEAYGHITSSKSAQLRLVLHLWAEGIRQDKVKAAELNQSIEGA